MLNVHILTEGEQYEGESILGVYATTRKANAALKKVTKGRDFTLVDGEWWSGTAYVKIDKHQLI